MIQSRALEQTSGIVGTFSPPITWESFSEQSEIFIIWAEHAERLVAESSTHCNLQWTWVNWSLIKIRFSLGVGGQFGASEDTINTTLTFLSTYKVLVVISIYLNVCFWATNERKPNIHSLLSPFWSSLTAGQVVCSGFLDVIHWKLLFNAAEKTLMRAVRVNQNSAAITSL